MHLFECNKGKPLFPHAQSLSWTLVIDRHPIAALLTTFLTPSLRHLAIYARRCDELGNNHNPSPRTHGYKLKTLLEAVAPVACRLRTLRLDGLQVWQSLAPFAGHERLRELKISLLPTITPITISDSVSILSSLPHLERLKLYAFELPIRSNPPFGLLDGWVSSKYPFLRLQSLYFHCDLTHIVPFIKSGTFPALRHLSIQTRQDIHLQTIQRAISDSELVDAAPNLREFLLSHTPLYHYADGIPTNFDVPLSDLLQTLFALKELQEISLHLSLRCIGFHDGAKCRLHITDDDILQVSRSWPTLRRFYLAEWDEPEACQCPSLLALSHFAQYCPHLERLCIPRVSHRGDMPDTMPVGSHCLRELEITDMDVGKETMDTYLAAVFPTVQLGPVSWPEEEED